MNSAITTTMIVAATSGHHEPMRDMPGLGTAFAILLILAFTLWLILWGSRL